MAKVSICIPTYNRAHFLKYAVESVFNQTYQDWELIICDDASIDETFNLVNQWNNERIHYIRHPENIGRSRNMSSGFAAAKGEYFIKFDDDDALTPEFLQETVAILDREINIDFVCTNHWIINQQGMRMKEATKLNSVKWGKDKLAAGLINNLLEETFIKRSLQVGSTLFRRSCLTEVNYMRSQADGCEDFDLLVRLALGGKQAYFIPEFLMEYRFHGGQTSLKQTLHFLKAKIFCLNSYHFEKPELEQIRIKKLGETQQNLGLKLIESGDSIEGRRLIKESQSILGKSSRDQVGLLLSYLPLVWREKLWSSFRRLKKKDYTEKVRNS